jgi:copper homeostasis protein
MTGIIRESCVETRGEIDGAARGGADRIELCSRLDMGGLTPSVHMLGYARAKGLSVAAMVRRGAGFSASAADLRALKADIRRLAAAGADALVFGYLRDSSGGPCLDIAVLEALVRETEASAVRELVFHMAFDEIPESGQCAAIDTLSGMGFTRILTKGGRAGKAEDHLERLKALHDYAQGKINILCGGGVTDHNYRRIASLTGLTEFHGRRLAQA